MYTHLVCISKSEIPSPTNTPQVAPFFYVYSKITHLTLIYDFWAKYPYKSRLQNVTNYAHTMLYSRSIHYQSLKTPVIFFLPLKGMLTSFKSNNVKSAQQTISEYTFFPEVMALFEFI